jgi:hemerythrin-like domain-containing protein
MNAPTSPKPRQPRPQRPKVATLPQWEALDHTHREVLNALGRLATLVEHLDGPGLDDEARRLATDICIFFDGSARSHHAAEERIVFPTLLASGDADLVHHVKRLQQDHGWLEEDWLELEPQLKAVAEGYNWYDLSMLQHAVPVFAALYEEHIALEESLIYPEARRRALGVVAGEGAAEP